MNLYMKQIDRCREKTCGLPQGKGAVEGGMDWEFGINRCKLSYTEWIKQRGPTIQHRELQTMFKP